MNAEANVGGVNRNRLLWAGFMAILAAGVGFAIRGGIFDNWQSAYGFSGADLGKIGGAGFTGFCFGIVAGGLVADKIGYRWLVFIAFACHVLSAFVTFGASGPENAYTMLFWGMFLFAYANGTLEAVANPLVADLFPENRTHYLNILHASWPAGLVIGSLIGWVLDDRLEWGWKAQLALYLIPTVVYGIMFLGQLMPKSEAAQKGATLGDMLKDVGILGGLVVCFLLALFFGDLLKGLLAPADATAEQLASAATTAKYIGYGIGLVALLAIAWITKFSMGSILLFVLFVTHALVGSVELGTDQWAQNITGNLFTSEQGKWLFVWTSAIMFGLRFCAHWIEKKLKLNPIALLLVCSIIACVGLLLASGMKTFTIALGAMGLYAVGKTFFWPTMLAVASDRFPRTGAVAISIMGGIGMMSAGLIGTPGLGYAKDRFAGEALQTADAGLLEEYKSADPSTFLNIASTAATAIDGTKLGAVKDARTAKLKYDTAIKDGKEWEGEVPRELTESENTVLLADQAGDRKTLKSDAWIPGIMAVVYLLLLIYFMSTGGYRPLTIDEQNA